MAVQYDPAAGRYLVPAAAGHRVERVLRAWQRTRGTGPLTARPVVDNELLAALDALLPVWGGTDAHPDPRRYPDPR